MYAAVYDAPPEVIGGVVAVYDPLSWETGLSPQWRIESACPELVLGAGGGTIVVPQTGWVPPTTTSSSDAASNATTQSRVASAESRGKTPRPAPKSATRRRAA